MPEPEDEQECTAQLYHGGLPFGKPLTEHERHRLVCEGIAEMCPGCSGEHGEVWHPIIPNGGYERAVMERIKQVVEAPLQ